jgi:glutaredoxin 3
MMPQIDIGAVHSTHKFKFCTNCVTAKNLLQSLSIEYKEIDIETGDRLANFVANYPEARQMPQIFIGDQRVGGLAGLQAALKQMGKL